MRAFAYMKTKIFLQSEWVAGVMGRGCQTMQTVNGRTCRLWGFKIDAKLRKIKKNEEVDMKTVKRKFVEIRKSGDFDGIAKKYGIDPLVARIMRNRGVENEAQIREYLEGSPEELPSPYLLKDAKFAAQILLNQIEVGKHIRVIGDYDIDGVMSSYILTKGLRRLGANVSVQIPHRIVDGYGLNRNLIEEAKADAVDCIITCDNGISAIDEIALAKEYGMTVIVTDHHQVTVGIPDADAVVNPHLPGDEYPFKEICGASVAWKVLRIAYELANVNPAETDEFIENVGMATVGDIMPLVGENRVIVKEALRVIQRTKNLGMAALIRQCELQDAQIKAYHFGFVLGPCINATGRLDTASRALELFLTEDPMRALKLAGELVTLNDERKDLTTEGVEEAIRVCEENGYENDPILVLYLQNVHESIAGIVAGRIRERYYKPTFILTDGEDCIKGSARSIEGYSLAQEMAKHADLFLKFGGHPKAAGLSMRKEEIERFRTVINETSPITTEQEIETVSLDACPPLSYLTVERVEQLQVLEPFGNENAGPVFGASQCRIRRMRRMGKTNQILRITFETEIGTSIDGICFHEADLLLDFLRGKYGDAEVENAFLGSANQMFLSIVYTPKVNDYRGRQVQLEIKYYM